MASEKRLKDVSLFEKALEKHRGLVMHNEDILAALANCPTVDAVEVVHGRWEWLGPYRYNDDGMIGTCSVCKERLRLFAHNYCPNCGAKMDGGNGDV